MDTAMDNLKAMFGDLEDASKDLNEKVSFSLEEITNIRRELNIPEAGAYGHEPAKTDPDPEKP